MQKYLFNNFLGKGIMNKELVNRLTLFMLEGVKLTEEEKIEAIQKVCSVQISKIFVKIKN